MSNQPKDSSLSSPESEVFELLRSPKPRSMNDSTGATRSSAALPIRTTPSSAIHAADAGMAIAGEIPDNLFTHQVNIDPHLTGRCRRPCWTPTAFPCLDWSVLLKILLFKITDGPDIDHLKSDSWTLTAPPSNLPAADPGLKSTSKFYNKFFWFISDASSPCRSFN